MAYARDDPAVALLVGRKFEKTRAVRMFRQDRLPVVVRTQLSADGSGTRPGNFNENVAMLVADDQGEIPFLLRFADGARTCVTLALEKYIYAEPVQHHIIYMCPNL